MIKIENNWIAFTAIYAAPIT